MAEAELPRPLAVTGRVLKGTAEFIAEDSFSKFVKNATLLFMTGTMTYLTFEAIKDVAPSVKEAIDMYKEQFGLMIGVMIPFMFIFFIIGIIKAIVKAFGGEK